MRSDKHTQEILHVESEEGDAVLVGLSKAGA